VDVTSVQTAMRYFNSFYTGVYVYEENHDVVQYGDLILAADGVEISTSDELDSIIKRKNVGDSVELTVYRNREKITLTITVAEYIPEALQPAS
ncbi:MAG: PDZ domain-containing protein, partial [Clostridia bacterium]|nr:PDZ domain-containing protein [Clostridia bacterium]